MVTDEWEERRGEWKEEKKQDKSQRCGIWLVDSTQASFPLSEQTKQAGSCTHTHTECTENGCAYRNDRKGNLLSVLSKTVWVGFKFDLPKKGNNGNWSDVNKCGKHIVTSAGLASAQQMAALLSNFIEIGAQIASSTAIFGVYGLAGKVWESSWAQVEIIKRRQGMETFVFNFGRNLLVFQLSFQPNWVVGHLSDEFKPAWTENGRNWAKSLSLPMITKSD